jgi:adenylosuccinate synthase
LAETGLSPVDVDEVVLVIRSFPIRVGGNSGPLPGETSWEEIAASLGTKSDLREYTTVTNRLRRVGRFDADLVRRAVACNNPTTIVLNHMDYITSDSGGDSVAADKFVAFAEREIGRRVNFLGFSPRSVDERNTVVA